MACTEHNSLPHVSLNPTVFVFVARLVQATASELGVQSAAYRFRRGSTCTSVLTSLMSARRLYRYVRTSNIAMDETMFGISDPKSVTDLAGLQKELIKYRTELDKLYESLTASYGDLTNGEVSQTFADAVWTLQDKIGYVYGDVHNLIISLQLLRGLTPQPIDLTTAAGQTHEDFSTATTTATATASTTAELKHLSIIRSEAKYVSGNLKKLLRLWRNRCNA
ncbi:hypothetical protein PoB_003143400 [Plakobranchus ocellatus]|uniref:Ciliary BBSome complex subunit 2 C-terminal domain-containing protein n=1 Tax=Plakobranchus ocellatus TaxID=259542 RepID=A0AAV4AES5_9GAST|nr:hypothetical protein PoB_003143400 [Plakobranchus ocellatus]